MKNKKTILLSILALVLLCLLLWTISQLFLSTKKTEENLPKTVELKDEKSELDDIQITLLDYQLFKWDEFDFLLATVQFKSDKNINVSLTDLQTNQNISLASYNDYTIKLESKGYYLLKEDVSFSIETNDQVVESKIFIPILKGNDEVVLRYKNQSITFDLKHAKSGDIEIFKDKSIMVTDNQNYKITILDHFDASGSQMYLGDQEYNSPSSIKTYAIKLRIESIGSQVFSLDKAVFVNDHNQERLVALDKDFKNTIYQNIISKDISSVAEGYIFFEAYNPKDNPIVYQGKLHLFISIQEEAISTEIILDKGEIEHD